MTFFSKFNWEPYINYVDTKNKNHHQKPMRLTLAHCDLMSKFNSGIYENPRVSPICYCTSECVGTYFIFIHRSQIENSAAFRGFKEYLAVVHGVHEIYLMTILTHYFENSNKFKYKTIIYGTTYKLTQ